MATVAELLVALEQAPRFRFADWPNKSVPHVAAAVYAVWQEKALSYIGMSGRGLSADAIASYRSASAKNKALRSRLASHASGRRSGDQFCVYVADRYVLNSLTAETVQAIASGEPLFDQLVKQFIRRHLTYSYVEVPDNVTAHAVEDAARAGDMTVGPPLLNPIRTRRPSAAPPGEA
jgi:hypothetical protein